MSESQATSQILSKEVELPLRFGWVGLGQMGYPMATQLRRKLPSDRKMVVFDLDREACERFVRDWESENEKGVGEIRIVMSSREVAEDVDCFISIVPEGSHVKAVYLTPEIGVLAADTAGKLFIDCSTIDTSTSLLVGSAVQSSSPSPSAPALFFDAPVSGGILGAQNATLTFMVGCSSTNPSFPLLHILFSLMGSSICPVGGPSLGLAAKLSNNYLSALIALATSEAMNLGMRLGLDPHVLSACIKESSGSNYTNTKYNPVPGVCPDAAASKGYEGGFKVKLMIKDMSLAIKSAEEVDAKLVLSEAGLGAYEAAQEDPRCRDRDSRVVYRWLGGIEPEVP